MILHPDAYFNRVEEITIDFLKENNIKVLILDVDNTLIDYRKILSDSIVDWALKLKGQGVKLYILSNTNKKQKVKDIAEKLDIKYYYFAKKPLKCGFLKIQRELKENSENIAVVGDQIFTDIIGANRCKMYSILVEPINDRDFWYTAWKRPIEDKIKEKFIKEQTKEK